MRRDEVACGLADAPEQRVLLARVLDLRGERRAMRDEAREVAEHLVQRVTLRRHPLEERDRLREHVAFALHATTSHR